MTDVLDPLAAYANQPRMTKEARRAAAKAGRQKLASGIWGWLRAAAPRVPIVLLVLILLAVVVAASIFDWFMSARGWRDLLPELGFFANLGAGASVGFWYLGLHYAIRFWRKADRFWAIIWTVVAVSAYVICIVGVLIATVTNTSEARAAAEKSRAELLLLESRRDDLEAKLEVQGVEYWELRVKGAERKLAGQLAIAKGTLEMPDLDIDGACGRKLNFDQRRACVHANGGVDPHTGEEVRGARAEIEAAQQSLKQARLDQAGLVDLQTKIAAFELKKGDATAVALGEFLDGEAAGNTALMWAFAILAGLFLLCGGFFSYWLWALLMPEV
jgi:hypothetical protein